MCHPSRVHGVLTINNRAGASMGRFMEGLKVVISSELSFSIIFSDKDEVIQAGRTEGHE